MTELNFDQVVEILDQAGFRVLAKSELRGEDQYLDKSEFKYILWLDRLYQKIRSVPGHIVEIGVARGRNSILFGHMIRMSGEDDIRHYYGFDTFDGYTEEDLARDQHLSAAEWKLGGLQFVEQRLAATGLSDICFCFKGDIRQTADAFVKAGHYQFAPDKLRIAMLYIDCNAFGAAKYAMDYFHQYMAPGGIICIDEKKQGGETEALLTYCEERGLAVQRDAGPFGVPAYVQMANPATEKPEA